MFMKKLIISSLGVFLNLLLVFANPNMVVEYEFEGALVDRLNNSTLTAFNSTPSNNRNNIEQGFFMMITVVTGIGNQIKIEEVVFGLT